MGEEGGAQHQWLAAKLGGPLGSSAAAAAGTVEVAESLAGGGEAAGAGDASAGEAAGEEAVEATREAGVQAVQQSGVEVQQEVAASGRESGALYNEVVVSEQQAAGAGSTTELHAAGATSGAEAAEAGVSSRVEEESGIGDPPLVAMPATWTPVMSRL
jgi:hypothetical protein